MLKHMKNKYKKTVNFILAVCLLAVLVCQEGLGPLTARASSISDIEGQINQRTSLLDSITNQIVELESEQDILQEQIDDLNAEIVNTMASIGLKEDEIAAKEGEIAVKEGEIAEKEEQIVQKKNQIDETEEEYQAAAAREETQRENMAVCARLIYERGEDSYFSALLEGKGLSDILNQMDRIEKVHDYESSVLADYIQVKNEVHDLWIRLEEEKEELEAHRKQLESDKQQLESDKQQLEADRAELSSQKASLDSMLAKKKQESANYAAEIKKARQDAAVAKKLLQQDKEKLRKAQEAAASQNNSNNSSGGGSSAGSGGGTTSAPPATVGGSGSGEGRRIAEYALQFVGNPYVSGGTSLTSGADCSGFTYRVFSDCGYQISRTSYSQRSDGVGVSYSDAQPGDIICYEGHVGLYIGDGKIVHASNSRPYPSGGIKVSQAQYRAILGVRRIVN